MARSPGKRTTSISDRANSQVGALRVQKQQLEPPLRVRGRRGSTGTASKALVSHGARRALRAQGFRRLGTLRCGLPARRCHRASAPQYLRACLRTSESQPRARPLPHLRTEQVSSMGQVTREPLPHLRPRFTRSLTSQYSSRSAFDLRSPRLFGIGFGLPVERRQDLCRKIRPLLDRELLNLSKQGARVFRHTGKLITGRSSPRGVRISESRTSWRQWTPEDLGQERFFITMSF